MNNPGDIYTIYKPIGETPLETITKFKLQQEGPITKICCSGRLDPMAHGQLLVLTNDKCKDIGIYNAKNKTYKFSFVVGVTTDTTDVLGIVSNKVSLPLLNNNINYDIESIIKSFNNKTYDQEYHIFSSMPVTGPQGKKPIWYYSKNNIIIESPKKQISIYRLDINEQSTISSDNLYNLIKTNTSMLNITNRDQFRYDNVLTSWANYFENMDTNTSYIYYTCTAHVSSGTYIRQLVKDIGKIANLPVLVTDLHRIELLY